MGKFSKLRRALIIVLFAVTAFALAFALGGCSNDSACTHENVTVTVVDATCTEAGSRTEVCNDCGEVVSTTVIAALGHDYVTDSAQTVAATCLTDGKKVEVCSRCGEVRQTTLDKTGHDYAAAVTAPTCTEQGYTTYTCKSCDYSYVGDYTAAAGHAWTGNSCEGQTCSVCQTQIPATTSHNYVAITAADCTKDVEATYQCTLCGDSYKETLLAAGHTYATDESGNIVWTTDGEPTLKTGTTCTYITTYYVTCSVCGEKIVSTTESDSHTYVLTETKTATCVSAGTKQMKCTKCGDVKSGTTVTYYAEHTYNSGTVSGDTTVYTCTVCKSTKTTYNANTASVSTATLSNDVELASGTVISMSSEAVSGLTSTDNLSLAANTLTQSDLADAGLSSDTLDRVGESTVYSITLSDGTDNITTFSGTVTVKLPYTLSAGEDETDIAVFYLSDSGVEVIDGVYSDGYVVFETTHFSFYTIGRYTSAEICARYGHDIKVLSKSATCTEAGYYIEYCTRCDSKVKDEAYSALGHDFEKTVTKAATCTENGTVTYVCKTCGASYSGVLVSEGHNWTLDIDKSVAATCTAAGSSVYVCANCGQSYSVASAQLEHQYEKTIYAPTCTSQGYTVYTCSMCGTSYSGDYVAANGHTWNSSFDCVDKTCLVCGATLGATASHSYDANGVCTVCGQGCSHSYTSKVTAPTCTSQGYTTYTCSICGSSYIADYTAVLEHSYVAAVTASTCTSQGYTTYTCSICGSSYVGDYTAVLEHSYVAAVTAPTCTSQGYTTYTCSVCGDSYVGNYTAAAGHNYSVSWTWTGYTSATASFVCANDSTHTQQASAYVTSAITTEATCTGEGTRTYTATVTLDNKTYTDTKTSTISAKEHTEGTPVRENEVGGTNCDEEGSYDLVVYCTVCNTELSREEVAIAAKDHSWDSGKVTSEATTTSTGVKTYTCTECGATKTSTIAALNGGGNAVSPSDYAAQMASTLNSDYGLSDRTSVNASGWSVASGYYTYLAQTIKTSKYDYSQSSSLSYTEGTEIGIAIGYNSTQTGAFYATSGSYAISDTLTIPGGYVASAGTIKPAFYAIQQALGVSFVDNYTGLSSSANIDSFNASSIVSTGAWGTTVDVATTDLSVAVSEATYNNNILNLADYLDYMPNFKKYLEDNPVVYLSLLQSGMSTTNGSGAAIYIAPYFDGVEDLERYCMIRQDWVIELLDYDLAYDGDTYAAACASSTSVSGGWMGVVGSYSIESSTEDGSGDTFIIIKNYDAALAAAKDNSTELGAAYYAIAGSAYSGTSGNIVDIMNAAIAANNGATGKQLATLYRAYIDVAYQDEDGNAAYATRSDLFNGYSAAWDVDDLVAMLRIVKTNSQNVGLESCTTTGIFPRDSSNDRAPDMVRLAAQLYGERGAESRYEYTYIDSDGNLQDARANASFYQALENFGELASEGLVYDYYNGGAYTALSSTSLKGSSSYVGTGFMMYDYSQTQTTQMFDTMYDSFGEEYAFGAINTPVSKWDVDGDGTKEEIMRFTESWRSTKTGGLAVAASVANDSNKLAAVLAFIDYLYSNDGQISATYGIQSTNGNTNPNGTWYGNYVGSAVNSDYCELIGGQWVVKEEYESMYFAFNNNLYTGYLYNGKMTPIITDELYEDFTSKTSETCTFFRTTRGSFTTYSRQVLGSSLLVSIKDQSFETQMSSIVGRDSTTKVSVSLANGTIKHLSLSIDKDNLWYTCVPASLPLTVEQSYTLYDTSQNSLRGMTGTNIDNSKNFYSIFHHIIWEGYNGTYNQQGITFDFSSW